MGSVNGLEPKKFCWLRISIVPPRTWTLRLGKPVEETFSAEGKKPGPRGILECLPREIIEGKKGARIPFEFPFLPVRIVLQHESSRDKWLTIRLRFFKYISTLRKRSSPKSFVTRYEDSRNFLYNLLSLSLGQEKQNLILASNYDVNYASTIF